jgi:hypothetical protein
VLPKVDSSTTPISSPLCVGLDVPNLKPATRGRAKRDIIPDIEIDLTEQYDPQPKSRRAADLIQKPDIWETLEVDLQSDDANTSSASTKRQRGRPVRKPKAVEPKVKRLTYKQALKVIQTTNSSVSQQKIIPKRNSRNSNKSLVSPAPIEPPLPPQRNRYSGIDLTGEVELTDIHSKAPLFQKQPEVENTEEKMETEEEFDLDDLDVVRFKVRTNRGIEIFPIRNHEKLQSVFTELSKRENVPVSNIFIFDDDKRIDCNETPHEIGYKISKIYNLTVMNLDDELKTSAQKKNQIKLKFQWDKDRHSYKPEGSKRLENSITISVSKFDLFSIVIKILCEKINLQSHQVQLIFDGDEMNLNSTPSDEGFEGGETLDCKITV